MAGRQGCGDLSPTRTPAPNPMRHFCATHPYQQAMELEAIGALLGHTWISTTGRYIHVPAEQIAWLR
ncbi:tyrosine-type recombinase/integrase, partial [Streptomyces sp. NPDC058108]|uniref:tyrosine-type recombinase/integrase n=1 Tax=Streptomyces sp. NPDC058108 TaxID=3346344 RepID=UPI0036E22902